jgi:hypothetical protein
MSRQVAREEGRRRRQVRSSPPTQSNSRYGQNGWLGLAQIWVSGNHITQATTKVNETYFNMPQYDTPAWRRLVMCQEVAHDFGLDHQDETFDNPNLGFVHGLHERSRRRPGRRVEQRPPRTSIRTGTTTTNW